MTAWSTTGNRWRFTDRVVVYVHAEPVDKPEGKVGPMFGGNFIYTSDSRFPNDYPIPVHDRFETPEQAEILSR